MIPPDPDLLCADAPRLADALTAAGWSAPALDELLGGTARGHLDRGELAPLLRRTGGGSPLETLARLFVLGVPVSLSASRRAGVPETWLRPDGYGVAAPVRLESVLHDGIEVRIAHDPSRAAGDAAQPDQVLGLGAASRTLAAATPRTPVGRTLDLGTGCGVQALLAVSHSSTVVATDVNPRAAGYTRLAAALNGVHLDVRTGDLLEPVAGELFDLVVSNPPFVLGAPGGDGGVRHTYRDAGPDGDGLCRRLVAGLPSVLVEGGTAVLLANWLHVEGEDGDDRVRSWFGPDVDGWVVQRELAAPQDYVTAWLRDTGEPAGFEQAYGGWLDWFAERRVEAVAFGILALRKRRDGGGRVGVDEVPQQVAPAWGEQVPAFFAGQDALDRGVLATAWRLRDDVRLHSVAERTEQGWQVQAQLLRQGSGLRWSGGVDVYGATLLAGCDGTRRLGELLAVLAASAGIGEDEAAEQVVPVVQRLVEQGFLIP
ncbi:MAG: methyltransferase [Actinobacteria bacterium]|nr:methyltransferase [Actinomycetota bacterium]